MAAIRSARKRLSRIVVKVSDDRRLTSPIAYRTNNPNPISLKDLNANDQTQIQLKSEFDKLFGFDSEYNIKRGEATSTEALENEFAGQVLLSLYGQQPWSAHQDYKVFISPLCSRDRPPVRKTWILCSG
jgi:hypothetical protein